MNTVCSFLLIISCIVFNVNANACHDKGKTFGTEYENKCTKNMIYEVFDEPTRSSSCSKKTESEFPDWFTEIDGKAQDAIKHVDFLPYTFDPKGMDNFVQTERKLSEAFQRQTNLIGAQSVRFWLGTRDHGKTLLIFFPGTANIHDVAIDLKVKHHTVRLPMIVQDRFKYKDPKDPKTKYSAVEANKLKLYNFRIHQGIHKRLMDAEIQVAIQQVLLFLYSGEEEMKPIPWQQWCEDNVIEGKLKAKLEELGFRQKQSVLTHDHDGHYTNPTAMHIKSKVWEKFVNDPEIKKEDIVNVTTAIIGTKEKLLKNARMGMQATKIEHLIISGHSLGGGYATYFFLRLYGDGYSRGAPGFHLLPDDVTKVTVIPYAPPSIVYFEDAGKIKGEVLNRILNIWNYADPVPIILNGMEKETEKNIKLGIGTVMKYKSDNALCVLGTNQPIGNIMIIFTGKKRIKLSDEEQKKMKEKNKKGIAGVLGKVGIKIHNEKNWKHVDDEESWFKIIPWKEVKPYQKTLKHYYTKYGAKCLWKLTSFGALGAIGGAMKHHPLKKYKESILRTCLKSYLNEHSSYWKDFVMKRIVEKKEEDGKSFGEKLKGFLMRGKKKKEFEKEKETKVSPEEQIKWVPKAKVMDDSDNYMDMVTAYNNNNDNNMYMVIVAVLLVIVACSFGFGAVCGFIVALIVKKAA